MNKPGRDILQELIEVKYQELIEVKYKESIRGVERIVGNKNLLNT